MAPKDMVLGVSIGERHGKAKWRRHVADERDSSPRSRLTTVIGGGNVGRLAALPPRTRAGDNANALRGGFLLWQEKKSHTATRSKRRP
jgi:polyphosphate glucokinase